MRAILHIGTEKTGTTSLQNFMNKNRRDLLAQGILYPEAIGGMNHRMIAAYGLLPDGTDDFTVAMDLTTPEKIQNWRCQQTVLARGPEASSSLSASR